MWHEDQREQRIADAAYEQQHEERMKRNRAHGERPVESRAAGLGSRRGGQHRTAAGAGVTRCLTCLNAVDMRFSETDRVWRAYEHGTDTPHRCKETK